MAASSQSAATFVQPLNLSHLSSGLAGILSQSVRTDQEVTGQHILLAAKALGEAKNWSTVAISQDSWGKLFALRSQLMSESDELISAVSAVNPHALYMSENAMVVQVSRGLTPVKSFLTMEEDCGLLIPLSIPRDDPHVTLWDTRRAPAAGPLELALSPQTAYVVSGTGSMRVASSDPLVFVIFCLAGGGS